MMGCGSWVVMDMSRCFCATDGVSVSPKLKVEQLCFKARPFASSEFVKFIRWHDGILGEIRVLELELDVDIDIVENANVS